MKQIDFEKLKKGDKVTHTHLGICTVEDFIPDFGPTLKPDTEEGSMKLFHWSGTTYPALETSNRLVQKINN